MVDLINEWKKNNMSDYQKEKSETSNNLSIERASIYRCQI